MGRVSRYRRRVRSKLEAAFAERHTPHQVAGSFAIGVFVTPAFVVIGFGVAAGYAVVYVLVIQYRRRDIEPVEAVVDDEFLGE
jgi:uncharacterized protein (DUF2062 family)